MILLTDALFFLGWYNSCSQCYGKTLFLCGCYSQCTKHKSGCQSLHGNLLLHLLQIINENTCNARTVSLFLECRQCKNRIQQTQNRKTQPENRNTNPKTEINIPKRKHVQKNTKLNHKTEREFKNTNHDQKPQNRNNEIM